MYSYLKFIGHPKVGNLATFKAEYVGGKGPKAIPAKVRNDKLRELLESFTIMRSPGHHFLGTALVKLPETHPDTVTVELSKEEKVIGEFLDDKLEYHITQKAENSRKAKESSQKAKKNSRKAKENSRKAEENPRKVEENSEKAVKNSRPCLYEAMMRTRQFAASPLLLEKLVKEQIWTQADVESMREKAHAMGCTETPFIDQFEKWLIGPISKRKPMSAKMKNARQLLGMNICPKCSDQQNDPQRAEVCTHSQSL